MGWHQRLLLLVGSGLITALIATLAIYTPEPAPLSSVHARVAELTGPESCNTCHTATGLTDGCLSCHSAIAQQLDTQQGYHAYLLSSGGRRCTPCHSEHFGSSHTLVSEISWGPQVAAAFKHPHVDFDLEGAHDLLACAACHADGGDLLDEPTPVPTPIAVIDSEPDSGIDSFLGVAQDCNSCHQDPHAGGLARCRDCHEQHEFVPPTFDHSAFLFLEAGHDGLSCDGCHDIMSAPTSPEPASEVPDRFPFAETRGADCSQCHVSPHLAPFSDACSDCHSEGPAHWQSAFSTMSVARHAATGFAIEGKHADIECGACHAPEASYSERHPDPRSEDYARREDDCEGCHDDPHGGQFADSYPKCLDCHLRHDFNPTRFAHVEHQRFPLIGSHAAVACNDCHSGKRGEPTPFVTTPNDCRSCHADPHGGQFAEEIAQGDCTSCHRSDSSSFDIADFDHEGRTGFALRGAHAVTECAACHESFPTTPEAPMWHASGTDASPLVMSRRYRGTPNTCADCHEDVHAGQFEEYSGCDACHVSETSWQRIRFDHNHQSRFKLTGGHARLPCSGCHKNDPHDEASVVRYRPLQLQCRDCHGL